MRILKKQFRHQAPIRHIAGLSHRLLIPIMLLGLFGLNTACTTATYAPVEAKSEGRDKPGRTTQPRSPQPVPGKYRIRSGDTLYSIAWRYGLDYHDVASWNNIRSPYLIRAGEYLSLKAPGKSVKSTAKASSSQKKTARKTVPDKTVPITTGPLRWQWPTRGKLVQNDTPFGKKGVDILGKSGQPVRAAADGEVVYSGSGLVGYGKLIIIKHNDVYLSAYGHNSKLLVKEGHRVKSGQTIAAMGKTGTTQSKLHFEIRKNGKPVPPQRVLPKI